jgi:Predicted membrane protein
MVLDQVQQPTPPDLLLYWAETAGDSTTLPADALLLGPLEAGKQLKLPAANRGYLILYSLAHRERVGFAELSPGPEWAMSNFYQAVNWNRQKRIYDTTLATGVVLYLASSRQPPSHSIPNATAETTLIRALGTCALLLLHLILCIGPLCRLNPRFLPLLYNRRHLGVTMFILALAHATFATIQFHALGDVNPLVSILIGSADARRVSQFPFELAGAGALGILFLMAATSHDFWLANLTARSGRRCTCWCTSPTDCSSCTWVLARCNRRPIRCWRSCWTWLVLVLGLHLAAAFKERRLDGEKRATAAMVLSRSAP